MEAIRSRTDCTETLSTEVVVAEGRKTSSNTGIVKTCTVSASRVDVAVASFVDRSLEGIRVPVDSNNSFFRWHNVEKLVHCLEVPEPPFAKRMATRESRGLNRRGWWPDPSCNECSGLKRCGK